MNCSRCVALVASAALLTFAMAVLAQDTPPPPGAQPVSAPPMSQDQLDSLLAPIALYPDQLLSQVLMASTYPLEVVQAARFVKANPNLTGAALDDALQNQDWDPSVLSLAAFPQILDMMNEHLDWTQRLGDAFLDDEAAVMNTVQSLRLRAQQAGNLQSNEQQKVIVQERTIIIEPAQPQVVFVPVYNPTVVFGPWWAPAYTPWFWYPPPIWGFPPYRSGAFVGGVFWGRGWAITANNWGWSRPNWNNRTINITINNNNRWTNRPQFRDRNRDGNWNHSPGNRRGVAYRDRQTNNRYRPTSDSGVRSRQDFRGRDNATRPSAPSTRPAPGTGTGPSGPGGGNNASRPGGGGNRPTPGTDNNASRPGGGGGNRPSPGTGNNVARPSPGTGNNLTRPSPGAGNNVALARPAPLPGNNQSRPSSPAVRPTPGFTPESRPQVQRDQNRGAQSRAAMQQSQQRPSGGNRGGGGGGGGGNRGGGGGQGRGR